MTDASGPPPRRQAEGNQESRDAQGKAQEVAGQAQEKMQQASGQAQEKAQEAAGKAQEMLREQVDQRSKQAGGKVTETAEDLRSVGKELRTQGKDTPARLADNVAERTERLGSYLTESDADSLLSDVEDFGRRQPLAVLAGGLVVGIAAARFLKASSRSRYQGRAGFDGSTREPSTPLPVPPPAYETEPVGAPGTATRQPPVPSDPAIGRAP